MKRVASLYLPWWPIDRLLRQEGRHRAPPPEAGSDASLLGLKAAADAEQGGKQCDAPRDSGWRPGARWARDDRTSVERRIAALPLHQRPPMREMGRRSEAVGHPFKALPPDEGAGGSGGPLFPGAGATGAGTASGSAPSGRVHPHGVHSGRSLPRALSGNRETPGPKPTEDRGTGLDSNPSPRLGAGRDGARGDRRTIPPRQDPATPLAAWNAVPGVRFPGEGPHPDKHGRRGSNDPHAHPPGPAAFFDTARSMGGLIARVGADGGPARSRPAPPAPGPPLVTVGKSGGRVEIAAVSPAAAALGLAPGMALTQARASVPGLVVRDADPDGDRAALHGLAVALARRWTPIVTVSDERGLLLDLTGVAHLHGGEARLARRLVRLLAARGIDARIAIADTAGAAWALARHGAFGGSVRVKRRREIEARGAVSLDCARPGSSTGLGGNGGGRESNPCSPIAPPDPHILIVPPGGHPAALAPLPVAGLRLEAAAVDTLGDLGVDSIAGLMALPRAPMVRRLGKDVAARLDQALGTAAEPSDPVVPTEPIVAVRRFAEPIATAEPIARWLDLLVRALCDALARAGLGARAVALDVARVDGDRQRLLVGLARPGRDPHHLMRLMAMRIETIDPGFGIDAMTLTVLRADPLAAAAVAIDALAADGAAARQERLSPLVDTLAARVGPCRLWRTAPVESDVPERAARTVAALDPPPAEAAELKADDVRRLDTRARIHAWSPRWPRPALLLRHPERLDAVLAELPDRPPARFTWRGRPHRVVRADGPERIGGEWWVRTSERQAIRDYFRVEDEAGHRFWLFRRGDGVRGVTGDLSWYMHGTFG